MTSPLFCLLNCDNKFTSVYLTQLSIHVLILAQRVQISNNDVSLRISLYVSVACMMLVMKYCDKNIMTLWMYAGLCLIVFLHFMAMSTGHWYNVSLDLNNCLSCGKLITTFGELLENTTDVIKDMDQDVGDITGNRSDVYITNKLTDREIAHDIANPPIEESHTIIIEDFTIENSITVYFGLMKNTICSEHLTLCADINHEASYSVFDSIKCLQTMQGSMAWIKLCTCLSTVVLLLTIVIIVIDIIIPNAVITGFCLYSLFSLVAVIIASFPYSTINGYDVISLCVPWALLCTILATYISTLVGYHLFVNKRHSTEHPLTMWHLRNMKLV